jgi:hypothetical protein
MSVRPVFQGVVDRAFLLPNGQNGAAVRLDEGRLICGWAQARHAPGAVVDVCHVGGDEWGVLGPVEVAA